MPWKCPACSQEIQHDPADDGPRIGVLYRCHLCRMELVSNGAGDTLLMTADTADDGPSTPNDPSPSTSS